MCSSWPIPKPVCSILASLCWRHDSCSRIRFVSLLLLLTGCYTLLSWWEPRSTLKVFIIHLFGCVPFHLVNHSHLYRAMSTLPVPPSPDYTLKPWGQTPFTPQPLSLISLMHGLFYINPPILKRRISILLGRGWLRRDQRASGLSACWKARRLALCNTTNSLLTPKNPFCIHIFINFVY